MLRLVSKRILGAASWEVPLPALQVLPRFYRGRNVVVGSFDENDLTVGTGLVGAPACRDVMKLQTKDYEKTGKIVDARSMTSSCHPAIASSSVSTEWVEGNQMDEVVSNENIDNTFHFNKKDLLTEDRMWDLYNRWLSHYEISRSIYEKHKRFYFFQFHVMIARNSTKVDSRDAIVLDTLADMTDKELCSSIEPNIPLPIPELDLNYFC